MAVRVNLKTTFTVHKSSFCVRILLPLCSALLLLLIRFMGDKSAGAPKPLLPPAGSLLSLSQSSLRWEHTGELSKYTIATIINVALKEQSSPGLFQVVPRVFFFYQLCNLSSTDVADAG